MAAAAKRFDFDLFCIGGTAFRDFYFLTALNQVVAEECAHPVLLQKIMGKKLLCVKNIVGAVRMCTSNQSGINSYLQ